MISLIMTVKNEILHLPAWFESLKLQTRQPDEIIIVDGGSNDGTWEFLQQTINAWPQLRVFQKAGNISVGRNEAIRQAAGDIIVSTDAGCTYEPTWFEELTTPLGDPQVQFVTTAHAPWLLPHDTLLAILVAAATTPRAREFVYDWPPSSRSIALRRSVWEVVGGYPEWLPICEDVIFDFAIFQKGIPCTYVRQPLVRWRPRLTVRSYLKQLYLYTRGDGHAQLFFYRQLIRYGVYGGAMLVVIAAAAVEWRLLTILIPFGFAYMKNFWQRWIDFSRGRSLRFRIVGACLLPGMVAVGDIAKMVGWPVGVWQRWMGIVRKQ